jgi:hypothetical protein
VWLVLLLGLAERMAMLVSACDRRAGVSPFVSLHYFDFPVS